MQCSYCHTVNPAQARYCMGCGHILVNGPAEPLDEILAYWYPSHQSFLEMRSFEITKRNFEIRKDLVDYAIVHRCNGENPPVLSS